jgi:aminoglycoside phosphotransferase (APT) family kinase protein
MNHLSTDFSGIPGSSGWRKIELVDKGWSTDKKFYIETADGMKLVVRLADSSQYEKKKTEYERMQAILRQGVEMSGLVDFGVCAHGKLVYILLTWIEGESAESALPKYDEREQRRWGFSAGQMLGKIHRVAAPDGHPDWETRMLRKVELKTSQYRDCGYVVPDDRRMMRFISEGLKYLRDRPQTLQHGDFHPGNLILTPQETLSLIDFNRTDFGDPWEEFVRVTAFTKDVSVPFALGQIDGYFGGPAPELFFRLLALYAAIDAHFGIIWAIPFGKDEIRRSLARSKAILEDYLGFETYVPVWCR